MEKWQFLSKISEISLAASGDEPDHSQALPHLLSLRTSVDSASVLRTIAIEAETGFRELPFLTIFANLPRWMTS